MNLRVLYTAEDIAVRTAQLGRDISKTYQGSRLLVVGILKGCFMFMPDLVRQIDVPLEIDFARISSYGNSDSPSSDVRIIKDVEVGIKGKDILVIDDIMDTGHTLVAFKEHLLKKDPLSVKTCTLINKICRREKTSLNPDFCGFFIENGFIVGYGLDYAEKYRNLPGLYVIDALEEKEKRQI